MPPQGEGLIASFGPYRVDFLKGELRKHGTLIKIQCKPLFVLHRLVSNPGEIVSREELREALWQEHVFVNFEKNLNTAVSKLRAVLGDCSGSSRYIKTIPQRGYRFTAPVEIEDGGKQLLARAAQPAGERVVQDPLRALASAIAELDAHIKKVSV